MSPLSSAFLAPLFLAALGLIPLLVILYLLKLRRTEVVIPSTLLWMRSIQDLTANAPFQRLRKNLLLLLQILILLFIILGMARPFVRAEGTRGDDLCLLLDHSASMQTREAEGVRLDLAKEKALELIGNMERGDRMMIIAFAETGEVLCELTDDKGRLRRAVQGVRAEDTRSHLRDATSVVRSLAPDNPDVPSVVADLELILLSDGKISDLEQLGAQSFNTTFIQVGETQRNAGIVAFSERREEAGAGARQAFVLVHNEHGENVDTTLSLYYEDEPIGVELLTLPAGESREMVFELPELDAGMLRAEIDWEDALAVDNTAWLSLQPDSYLDVLLVSEPGLLGARFLRRVLTLDPRVNLSSTTPEDYTGSAGYHLTVFNGWAPDFLPEGGLLYLAALPPISGLEQRGGLEHPPVLATQSDHPLMRFLNPGNTRVASAMALRLPEAARTLLSTENGLPLIADVSQGSQHMAVVAFDLADSNWPLHLSFPLFVQNFLGWAPGEALSRGWNVATGAPIEILAEGGADTARVETPGGAASMVPLDPTRPAYFAGTRQAGVYAISQGGQTRRVAVNLLDRNETRITPAESLPLGRGEVAAQTGPMEFNRELWPYMLACGLVLLLLEWWLYTRRAVF